MAKSNIFDDISKEIDFNLLEKMKISNQKLVSTVITNKNYNFEHFSVNLSSDLTTNIFISIINKSTYQNYESIIRDGDIESNLNIAQTVQIISGCFEFKSNYSIGYELKSHSIKFVFTVCFEGFYQITQSIELPEKVLNVDKQLCSKIVELESRICELETAPIILGFDSTSYGQFIKIKKNIELIDFRTWSDPKFKWFGNLWEFNNFENLKTIVVGDNQFCYDYNPCEVSTNIDFKIAGHDINSIGAIYNMNPNSGNSNWSGDKPTFSYKTTTTSQTVLPNMFDNPQIYFPNVKELIIFNTSGNGINFDSIKFRSLGKLSKVVFEQFANNKMMVFEFIKLNKIKHVIFNNCLNIFQLDLIKNYFETNNFILEITNK